MWYPESVVESIKQARSSYWEYRSAIDRLQGHATSREDVPSQHKQEDTASAVKRQSHTVSPDEDAPPEYGVTGRSDYLTP